MSSEELAMRNAEVEALRAELTKRDANTKEYREVRLVTEAFKDDDEKPMMDLIPADVTLELGRVLTYGARKYSRDNWRKGMRWTRPLAAALRHINAWQRGENLDPESGMPHLAHAIVSLMFLLTYQLRGIGEDDR